MIPMNTTNATFLRNSTRCTCSSRNFWAWVGS